MSGGLSEAHVLATVGETSAAYDTQPVRPTLTEEASRAADVPVDDNTRIVLSINVFSEDSEEIKRVSRHLIPPSLVIITDSCLSAVDTG